MKKLLTFAGVSALALITAAPDAFAIGVGIYNPECTPINSIPVKIYGLSSAGNTVTQVATGNLTAAGLNIPQTELAKIQKINSATNYTGGVTPRGIMFYTSGAASTTVPASTLYTAADSKYIVTKSSCGVDNSFDDMAAGNDKTVATTLSFGLPTGANPTLPTISDTIWTYLTEEKNTRQINMLIAYAATCVDGDYATCSLTVQTSGSAKYVNTCTSGSSPDSDDFGGATVMCFEDVNIDVDDVAPDQSAH